MFRRATAAFLAASAVVAFVAQPTFALGWGDDPFTGNPGAFAGPNNGSGPEVVCRYNSAGRLRSMTVKPLTMWSNYDEPTLVGQRFRIHRATEFHRGPLVYKGHFQSDLATHTLAADDFKAQRYYVTADLPGDAAYYVNMVALWYDSAGNVEGKGFPLIYDRYLLVKGAESRYSNACVFDHSVPYWNGG